MSRKVGMLATTGILFLAGCQSTLPVELGNDVVLHTQAETYSRRGLRGIRAAMIIPEGAILRVRRPSPFNLRLERAEGDGWVSVHTWNGICLCDPTPPPVEYVGTGSVDGSLQVEHYVDRGLEPPPGTYRLAFALSRHFGLTTRELTVYSNFFTITP